MEINPQSVFDVQKLAVEQISKTSGYVTALQKPLKKVYFPFKKNFAINPPLPYHKIVAGSQGIAFSSGTPTISPSPPKTSPQIDKYFQKELIISALSLKFDHQGKNKKFKGAFVTLDKKEREDKSKEYGELYFTLDEKENFLTIIDHLAIFICIVKSPNTKHLDAHIFLCSTDDQAIDILKALKGELVSLPSEPYGNNTPPTVTDQGNVNDQPTLISYPPLSSQQFQVSMPFYSPPPQSNPAEANVASKYGQMFSSMNLHSPMSVPQPVMPSHSPCVVNQFMNPPYPNHPYPTPTHSNYYPDFQMFGAVYPPQPNPGNYNVGNVATPLIIPRPNVTRFQETLPNFTDPTITNPNFPTKFPRPVPTTQYPHQDLPINTAMPNNTYPNLQTYPDPNIPQTGQPHFARQTAPLPNYPQIQPNIQQNVGSNTPYQGNQQPVMTRPAIQMSPTETNSCLGLTMHDSNPMIGQNLIEKSEPPNANPMSPPARPQQIRPSVPSKPSKLFINAINNEPKQEPKPPKKIIGVQVMAALPNSMQQQPPTPVNKVDHLAYRSTPDQESCHHSS